MVELTGACNHSCVFCYNTWKRDGPPPPGLDARGTREVLEAVTGRLDCAAVSLSGGEPLLRSDIFDIIALLKGKGVTVNLITNGSLLSPETIDRCLDAGVDLFQVTLLGDRPELHDRLSGSDSFETVIEAILEVRRRGGRVSTYFSGLADNIDAFGRTLELNVLLGVSHAALGRFTPGGAALGRWVELMPDPAAVENALQAGNEIGRKYPLAVSVSTPILPCLNSVAAYRNIRFAFCAVGHPERGILAVDPAGNLKVCSHSSHLLGNVLRQDAGELAEDPFIGRFTGTVPAFCGDCPDLPVCRGGCRSSALTCFGSLEAEDPYLHLWKSRARKPDQASFGGPGSVPAVECG